MVADIRRVWNSELVSMVSVQYPQDSGHNRVFCPFWQYWLVTDGVWRQETGPNTQRIYKGHLSQYAPFQKCRRIAETDLKCTGLRLVQETDKVLSRQVVWQIYRDFMLGEPDALRVDELVVNSLETPHVSPESSPPSWLKRVHDLIMEEPHRNDTLHQLAYGVGISPFHLSHEFSRWYGVSLARFRRRARLTKVASARFDPSTCGFYDASHLDRTARSEYGISASELKAMFRKSIQD
jgi:hypothetical protein